MKSVVTSFEGLKASKFITNLYRKWKLDSLWNGNYVGNLVKWKIPMRNNFITWIVATENKSWVIRYELKIDVMCE